MYLTVKVETGAKKETLKKHGPARIEVAIREEAERNMANKRVVQLIALHFGIPEKAVRIVKGHRSHAKLLQLVIPE